MLEEKAGYLDDMPMNVRIVNIKNYPLHYHYDHEFIYVLRGFITLKCGSSIYKMQQGDIFVANESEVHGIYDCSSDNIVLMIQISTAHFIRQFPTLPYNVYRTMRKEKSNEEIIVLRNQLLKIALNYVAKRPGYKMMNTNIMLDILNYCDKNFKSFYFEGKIVMHKKYDHPEIGERIGRTIDYIYKHHNEKLSLRELAEKEHFSEWYMSKLITAGTGLSFRELLAFARVEESEKILLNGSEKISSIAAKVGFSTTAYYEKFFKKWFGCHPEEYRKMYSNRIKGGSAELVFELSKSEAMSIILDSIKFLSFAVGEKAEKRLKYHELDIGVNQQKQGTFKQNVVCIDNCDRIEESFYDLRRLFKCVSTEYIENINDYNELDYAEERYALESVLVIPYMVKSMQENKQFRIPICSQHKGGNTLLDGKAGIFTAQGIPKSMFNASRLTKLLEGDLLSSSSYHIATRTTDGKQISIAIFNTEPELEDICKRTSSMREVQNAIDQFSTVSLSVKIEVNNVAAGMYQIIESTYTHRNSLFYLAYKNNFNRREMTDEEVLTTIELINPLIIEREEFIDGRIKLECNLKGASSKLIRIIRK